jgi:hypothetical protein
MKNKNPLYVVKGKTVQEAKGIFDLMLKKMNLEPAVQFIVNFFKILLEQVKTYPMFVAVKTMLDELMAKIAPLVMKVATR